MLRPRGEDQMERGRKLAPDTEDALDRFAEEQGIKREEALAVIARDWLIEQSYLRADYGEEDERSAQI